MISIKKIPLKDLQKFIKSDLYLSFKDKPISLLRAKSYINNPNANKNDINLYLALDNNKLIAFRTLFTDRFIYNNKEQKFCWLSGSWTHKDYRRKGISSKLLTKIHTDWNDKIIFANYATNSKALYDKTNIYTVLKTLKGIRYYRRICLTEILPPKNTFFKKIKLVLTLIDQFFNSFMDFRFVKFQKIKNYQFNKLINWDTKINDFLVNFKEKELFQRTIKTHKWVLNYPWIKTDNATKLASKNYTFSTYATKFISEYYIINNTKTNKIVAIVNISIRNKQLKIPYLYSLPEGIKPSKNLIFTLCKEHKINFATIYHDKLNTEIKNHRKPFLMQKEFQQDFYIAKDYLKTFKNLNNYDIQTGDGDGVFT